MRDVRDMETYVASQNAIEEIYRERRRQVDAEGWTPEHDDEHISEEMAQAAASYALCHAELTETAFEVWPRTWGREWFKPDPVDSRRDLIKAGALIVAEIERLDRAAAKAAA